MALVGLFPLIWLTALVVSVLVASFVGVAPFVHHISFSNRLAISSACSIALIPCVAYLNGGWSGVFHRNSSELFAATAGLALLTWLAAEFSPNPLWAASRVLPAEYTSQRVVVISAISKGVTYHRVNLTYLDPVNGGTRYVALSRRLFVHRTIEPGAVVTIHTERGLLGTYVSAITQ